MTARRAVTIFWACALALTALVTLNPFLVAVLALHSIVGALLVDLDGSRDVTVDVVLDGPPNADPGRFVEVETLEGRSTRAGRWIDRGDGTWALRLTTRPPRRDRP